ncbi:MAG: hypothetical protein GKR89_28590 [Candidatus Latescibacteria bacterium]|nr:hypothetical protein [Candidatus Latescibacterota bacterium]
MPQPILISDLSQCRPAHRLDRHYRHGTWRLVEYQTKEFSGTLIYSGPGMDSAPLTLPLNATGHHAIHLGIHYPAQFGDSHLQVRLSDDPAYTLVRAEMPQAKDIGGLPAEFESHFTAKRFADYQVSQALWKVADLSGQELIISRFNQGGEGNSSGSPYTQMFSNLAYVLLVV